jgi:D-arabinose 5-phosphate isomerase GutQ
MSETDSRAVLDVARDVIRSESAAVAAVSDQLDESFLDAVEMLANCTGKVFVTGSGTSGATARRMAHLLAVCGTPSMFIQPMDALHGTMGALAPNDILIAISKGGESDEINDFASRAKVRGVQVVAITSAPEATLAKTADLVVVLRTAEGGDLGGVVAMGSTLVTSVWGDALAAVLMRRRGYSWESFLHTHPAGAVGKMNTVPDDLGGLAD